jgi:SHS2 domain-containing protein
MQPEIGFREHAHTADWELEVWAPNLPLLLEQSARGMYALSGVKLQPGFSIQRSLSIEAADRESLLVRFLTELLWLEQDQNLGFDHFTITLEGDFHMTAELSGATITNLDKEIKAVTYHNLAVQVTPHGLHTSIVFDV